MVGRVGVMEGCGSVGVVKALPEGVPVSENEQSSRKNQSARNKGKERLHRWNRVRISMDEEKQTPQLSLMEKWFVGRVVTMASGLFLL